MKMIEQDKNNLELQNKIAELEIKLYGKEKLLDYYIEENKKLQKIKDAIVNKYK